MDVDTDTFSKGCEEMWAFDASTGDCLWRSKILESTGIPTGIPSWIYNSSSWHSYPGLNSFTNLISLKEELSSWYYERVAL